MDQRKWRFASWKPVPEKHHILYGMCVNCVFYISHAISLLLTQILAQMWIGPGYHLCLCVSLRVYPGSTCKMAPAIITKVGTDIVHGRQAWHGSAYLYDCIGFLAAFCYENVVNEPTCCDKSLLGNYKANFSAIIDHLPLMNVILIRYEYSAPSAVLYRNKFCGTWYLPHSQIHN